MDHSKISAENLVEFAILAKIQILAAMGEHAEILYIFLIEMKLLYANVEVTFREGIATQKVLNQILLVTVYR